MSAIKAHFRKNLNLTCFCPNTFADFVSVMVINSSQLQGEQSRDNYKMGQFYFSLIIGNITINAI